MARDRVLNIAYRDPDLRNDAPAGWKNIPRRSGVGTPPPLQRVSSHKSVRLEWRAILLYCVICIALALTHQGRLLELFFFVGAIFIAGLLLRNSFARYLSFVIWLHFLAPEVRRVADFLRGEFSDRSLVMLAPLLAASLSVVYFSAFRRLLMQRRGVPILLVATGLLYGFAVGILRSGLFAASYDFAYRVFPLLLACGILIKWNDYAEIRRSVTKTMIAGGIVIAAYGLAQYIDPPAWDAFWLANSGMLTQGVAEPFAIRVFGPMNSSGPYSAVLMCCVLFAIVTRSRLAFACLLLSVAALFLTLVRSSVGGLAIGIIFLAFSLTGRQRWLLVGGLIVVMLAFAPLAFMKDSIDGVTQRMSTVMDLKDDASFEARSGVYQEFTEEMKVNILGRGLGMTGVGSKLSSGPGGIVDFDSGVLEIPYVLGWPGSIFFTAGVVLFVSRALSACRLRSATPFARACTACSLGVASLMTFSNSLVGVSGLFFFVLATVPGVERRYHAAQANESFGSLRAGAPSR